MDPHNSLLASLISLAAAVWLSLYWLLAYSLAPVFRGHENNISKSKRLYNTPARCLAFFLFLVISFEFISLLSFIPEIKTLKNNNPDSTSLMRYRSKDQQPAPHFIPLEEVPEQLKKGVLACEDYNFYHHKGFSPGSIRFAFVQNIKHRSIVYGGSTITQQLARTLFLTPRKTLHRKFRELFIAIEMELILSKDRILELYINYAEWGPDTYGICDASFYHYGKAFTSLDFREYADLLSILPNPLKWDTNSYKQNETLVRRGKKLYDFFEITPSE